MNLKFDKTDKTDVFFIVKYGTNFKLKTKTIVDIYYFNKTLD